MDESAKRIFAEPAKIGAPVGNQNAAKDKENKSTNYTLVSTQYGRASQNCVHRHTQRKLDRLSKDRPDLLERVCSGELSVNRAAIEAGIVKQQSSLDTAKKCFLKLNEVERNEFLSWVSEV